MKKIILFATALAFVGSVSSCAKCYSCKDSIDKLTICSKDKDTQDDFNDEIKYYESKGYKCATSSQTF